MAITVATSQSESAPTELGQLVGELLDVLAGLHALLRRLTDLADQKLESMRRADADALQSCTAMEQRLLANISEQQRQRDAVLARLAQTLRWPEVTEASLAEIAPRLPEPLSSFLQAKNGALREAAATLQRKNRLAATVARNLHSHVRSIFAELAKVNQESVVYGPSGQHEQANTNPWVDAVG